METAEIELPEVKPMHQNAKFYNEDGKNFVEISFVGSKDSLRKKVQPVHMAQFKQEWDAFCDGKPLDKRKGTPLTDIMNDDLAEGFVTKNIHTLEELAALSDGQCQAVGHGTLTVREKAKKLLEERTLKQKLSNHNIILEKQSKVGAVEAEPSKEMQEVREAVLSMATKFDTLVELLSQKNERKKPGPKPKA